MSIRRRLAAWAVAVPLAGACGAGQERGAAAPRDGTAAGALEATGTAPEWSLACLEEVRAASEPAGEEGEGEYVTIARDGQARYRGVFHQTGVVTREGRVGDPEVFFERLFGALREAERVRSGGGEHAPPATSYPSRFPASLELVCAGRSRRLPEAEYPEVFEVFREAANAVDFR
jgi:hypothetical protein